MPLEDSDPQKWVMREHTGVKHRILRKYLAAWTRILSSSNPEVHYFDGFAGVGKYRDGEDGSPLLAMKTANRHANCFDTFSCTFNELNDDNYRDLVEHVYNEQQECEYGDKIKLDLENERFEDIAIEKLTSDDYRDLPSLVFIDPFGYKGVPFGVTSKIMNLPGQNEVFFNLMVDEIRRFSGEQPKEDAITNILGTEDWKYIRDLNDREKKEEEILKVFVNQLKQDADVEYAFPFQMKSPEKDTTKYYLVHATNHFKGFRVMKKVMFGEGADDLFAYLGPDHYGYDDEQTTLFETTNSTDTRIEELADWLKERFDGQEKRIIDIYKETFSETDLIEKHYKDAFDLLAERDEAKIMNRPDKGGSNSGKEDYDAIDFSQQNTRLTDW